MFLVLRSQNAQSKNVITQNELHQNVQTKIRTNAVRKAVLQRAARD